MSKGRPPERKLRLLELWISSYFDGGMQLDGRFNLSQLRDKLRDAELYRENKEKYETAVTRASDALSHGKDHGLFVSDDGSLWRLDPVVIACAGTDIFRQDWDVDVEEAVKRLWTHIRDSSWKEYYKPEKVLPDGVPEDLRPFIFQVRSSRGGAKWMNPYGIHLEEILEGYYPVRTVSKIGREIERSWQDGKVPVLVADPGMGKTTVLTVLGHQWSDGSRHVFLVDSINWESVKQSLKRFILSDDERKEIIVLIENVHLVPFMADIEELSHGGRVHFLLTSRNNEERLEPYRKEESLFDLMELPGSYNKELFLRFLKLHEKGKRMTRSHLRRQLRDMEGQNIIFLLTRALEMVFGSRYKWTIFVDGMIEDLRRTINDKIYWKWVLYVLSFYRFHEFEVTRPLLFWLIKYYDNSLGRSRFGETYTILEEKGIIIEDTLDNYFHLAIHPEVSEMIFRHFEGEVRELFPGVDLDSTQYIWWIERYREDLPDIVWNMERLITKIGLSSYNTLHFDANLMKEIILKNDRDKGGWLHNRINFLAYNYHQVTLSTILPDIFDDSDAETLIRLSENIQKYPNFVTSDVREMLPNFLVEHINVSTVSLQDIFESFSYVIPGDVIWDEGGGGFEPGYASGPDEYAGYKMFLFLSKHHDSFTEEVETYLQKVFEEERYDRLLEVLFRVPKEIIPRIDVSFIPRTVEFMDVISFERNNAYLYPDEFVRNTNELMELWSGPKFEEIREVVKGYIVDKIVTNGDFVSGSDTDEDSWNYNSKNGKVDNWMRALGLDEELPSMDLKERFDKISFDSRSPSWIARRLEFLREYNCDLYEFLISESDLGEKLRPIAREWYQSELFKDLHIRPFILDIPEHDITIDDVAAMDVGDVEGKIREDPFYDWGRFFSSIRRVLRGGRRPPDDKREKLSKDIDDLEQTCRSLRGAISKEDYFELLREELERGEISYNSRFFILLKSLCTCHDLNFSEFVDLFEIRLGDRYIGDKLNSILRIGFGKLDEDSRDRFFRKLLSEEGKFRNIKIWIQGQDRGLFTRSLLDSLEEGCPCILENAEQIRSLSKVIEGSMRIEFIRRAKSLELEEEVMAVILQSFLPEKAELDDDAHQVLRGLTVNYLATLVQNLPTDKALVFLQFLHDRWPDRKMFRQVCGQLGAMYLAELLDEKVGKRSFDGDYVQFFLDLEFSPAIIKHLITMTDFGKKDGASERLLRIFEHIRDNERLREEFPRIIHEEIESGNLRVDDIIDPRQIQGHRFDHFYEMIASSPEFTSRIRGEINNMVIEWGVNKRHSSSPLDALEFIELVNRIWDIPSFKEEVGKWRAEDKGILFRYISKKLLNLAAILKSKKYSEITEQRRKTLESLRDFLKSIFEEGELTFLFQDNLREYSLEEDISGITGMLYVIERYFDDIGEEVLGKFTQDDFLFDPDAYTSTWDYESYSKMIDYIGALFTVISRLPFRLRDLIRKYIDEGEPDFVRTILSSPKSFEVLGKLDLVEYSVTKLKRKGTGILHQVKLLLDTSQSAHFPTMWDLIQLDVGSRIGTLQEFLHLVVLHTSISREYEDVADRIERLLRSNLDEITQLCEDMDGVLKLYIQYLLDLDLGADPVNEGRALATILKNGGIDYVRIHSGDIEELELPDDIQKQFWKHEFGQQIDRALIFKYYWERRNMEMIGFLENVGACRFWQLLSDDRIFELMTSSQQVIEVIFNHLKSESVFECMDRVYDLLTLDSNDVERIIEKLLQLDLKGDVLKIFEAEDYRTVIFLSLRNSSGMLSLFNIVHHISEYDGEFEQNFIEFRRMFMRKTRGYKEDIGKKILRDENGLTTIELLRRDLPLIYEYTISQIKYEDVTEMLFSVSGDEEENMRVQETIWYLCGLEEWSEERKYLIDEIYEREKEAITVRKSGGELSKGLVTVSEIIARSLIALPLLITYAPERIDDEIEGDIRSLKLKLEGRERMREIESQMMEIIEEWGGHNF